MKAVSDTLPERLAQTVTGNLDPDALDYPRYRAEIADAIRAALDVAATLIRNHADRLGSRDFDTPWERGAREMCEGLAIAIEAL